MTDALKTYINQALASIGTPQNEREKGRVEAYCDILGHINGKKNGAQHKRQREVCDSGVHRVSDLQIQR
jgi:hypothetical protein